MNKNTYLFLFLLLGQIAAFGQAKLSKDFNVSVSTPYQVVDAPSKEYFSDGKGGAIMVKTKGELVTVQKFDYVSLKEVKRTDYEDFPRDHQLQKVLQIGDKLFYIFSSFNKKAKAEEVFGREINMADGTFKPAKLLFSSGAEVTAPITLGAPMTMFGILAAPKFEVYSSFDNSKLLVKYRTKPLNRKDSKNFDILGFQVFNTALEKQWGGEVPMPYTEKQMNNLAYTVGKDGTSYMLAYINESKTFELITVKSDLSVKPNKIAVDPGLYFQEFKLRETADGNLVAIGYYANGLDVVVNWTGDATSSFNTNGILSIKMAPDGKVVEKNNFEFPLALINQFESKKSQEKNAKREDKGKAGINDLKLISLFLNEDGSTTMIGEQQYMRKEMYMTSMQNIYYYGDVIATKWDKSGKLVWQKKLPKTQTGLQGKGGNSVRFIKGKGSNYVLFVDNAKNASIGPDEVPEKHMDGKGGFLTAYKLDDATGAVARHTLFDMTDIKGVEAFQFKTPRIFDATENIFLLEIYLKGKKDGVVKMELSK